MAQRRPAAAESGYEPDASVDEEEETAAWRGKAQRRDLVGFWLLGLCNNFAYVIMLSAAKDILESGSSLQTFNNGTEKACREHLVDRNCHPLSTGSVLLADILPALLIKVTAPFYIHLFPFGLRHFVVVLLQAASFLLVAMSDSIGMGLTGVALASFGSGLGEISYLSLASHFHVKTVSSWSSGTGGAGIFGALAYALMTDKKFLSISPRHSLLSMLVVPAIFAFAFWVILRLPPTVYRMSEADCGSLTVPPSYRGRREDGIRRMRPEENEVERPLLSPAEGSTSRVHSVRSLLKYIVPLVLVYFGEYFINQGLVELLEFDCSHGLQLDPDSQYRWYQVLYQLGVFISRSSSDFYAIPSTVLPLLAILQLINAVLFLLDAVEFFLPHIVIVFGLILYEGLLGGAAYVNTFRAIHDEIPADRREFSMGVVSISDTLGIVCSGFAAIPVHNWICSKPL